MWVMALSWVQTNGVLVMLIGLTISMSYMWWVFRASGIVAPQDVSEPMAGTGGTGGRQPPPRVHAGGGSASDSDEMPPLEDIPERDGIRSDLAGYGPLRIIATDGSSLMPLQMTFADEVLKKYFSEQVLLQVPFSRV